MMRTLLAIALFSAPTLAHAALVTITVDRLDDPTFTGPATGFCTAAKDDCSLRQALQRQNEDTANHYTINLPSGTITLTQGLLSVAIRPLTLQGSTLAPTIIDGSKNLGQKLMAFEGSGSAAVDVAVNDLLFRNGGGGDSRPASPKVTPIPAYTPQPGLGGAIFIAALANYTFNRCTFSGNRATSGGAMHAVGSLTIGNSTFSSNSATDGGALFLTGTATIRHSTFSGNSASGSGGAIDTHVKGAVNMFGVTLSGNRATLDGGALHFVNPATDSSANNKVAHTTIADNTSGRDGGGIHNTGVIVNLANSILSHNSATHAGSDCAGTQISSQGNNLISTRTGCTIATSATDVDGDAQLLPLANNGGATQTRALTCGTSPAIDTACQGISSTDPFRLGMCEGVDQRGFARPTDRTLRDKGAVEMLNADYGVTLAGPTGPVAAGATFNYTATVSNAGPDVMPSGAKLTLTLPAGVLTTGTLPSGCSRTGQLVTCALASIAASTSATFPFNLQASKAGLLSTTAVVASGTCSDNAANNSASHMLTSLALLTVADRQSNEGNSNGERTMDFTITVTPTSNQAITVFAQTAASGTIGTVGVANPGQDYQTLTATQKTIPANTSAFVISVPIVGDTTVEPTETFLLQLTNPSGADFGDSSAVGTIMNDDDAPPSPPAAITLANAQDGEGDSGTHDLLFTIARPNGHMEDLTYTVTASGGTATNGVDYTAPTTIVFPAADLLLQVHVAVLGDTVLEQDETFTLTVTGNGSNVSAIGTILNDETSPVVTITDVRVAEGQSGEIAATFLVTLDDAQDSRLDLNVSFVDGSATAGDDFRVTAPSVLSFAPGQTFAQVDVAIIGDLLIEQDEEDFRLRLVDALGAATEARAVIVDDDTPIDPVLDPPTDPAPTGSTGTTGATGESGSTDVVDQPSETPATSTEPSTPTISPIAVRPVDPKLDPDTATSSSAGKLGGAAKGCSAAGGDDASIAAVVLALAAILRRRRARVQNARS